MSTVVDSKLRDYMVSLRRDLHRHPELSWEEKRTSQRVMEELDKIGIPSRRLCDTGVVADLPGPSGVPVVALRADLDALPIHEETGLSFASVNDGIMHACGHDGHTAMLLGAATILARKQPLPVPVRLIFQPAEEKGAGARAMIEAGALEGVAMIFGGHLDRHFSPGQLVVTEGPVSAATDSFSIEISGKGGHAARPHESVDAVVVGSLMVMAIQTIVSREVNPAHPAVVSVGHFVAGTVGNAIAARAILEGTIRTQHADVREHFKRSIVRIAESVGKLHGASVQVHFRAGTPNVVCPPEATAMAREAALKVVGAEHVTRLTQANMGGEDFAYYLEEIPGCYIRFGSWIDCGGNYPSHSSRFDFDERALDMGAAWMVEVVGIAGRQVKRRQEPLAAVG